MVEGRLSGRVALVTGSSRGIGRAVALAFAAAGADVVVNYEEARQRADEVVEVIRAQGRRAIALQADVTDRAAVTQMVDRATDELGLINVLVNNAGLFRPADSLSLTDEVLDEMWAANVKGPLVCAQAVAPAMLANRYGKIVNISSVAGFAMATSETTPYSVTKAAVIALTKRLAFDLRPHVNVNCICPGLIGTGMADSVTARRAMQGTVERTMLGRTGTPEEIAATAVFLASQDAGFMTAQALTVDGGRMDFLSRSG